MNRTLTLLLTALSALTTLALANVASSTSPATILPAEGMTTSVSASNSQTPTQLAKHNKQDDEDYYGEDSNQHGHKHGKRIPQAQFCGPYFKPGYASFFHDYYSEHDYENLPPGLRKHMQKTGHLPPGLEKKAERGELPPGLQKRFQCGQTLPTDYSQYLYPVPEVAYQRLGPLPPTANSISTATT